MCLRKRHGKRSKSPWQKFENVTTEISKHHGKTFLTAEVNNPNCKCTLTKMVDREAVCEKESDSRLIVARDILTYDKILALFREIT